MRSKDDPRSACAMRTGASSDTPGIVRIPEHTVFFTALPAGQSQSIVNVPAKFRDLQVRVELFGMPPSVGVATGPVRVQVKRKPTSPLLWADLPEVVADVPIISAAAINAVIGLDMAVNGAVDALGFDELEFFNQTSLPLRNLRVQIRVVPGASIPAQTER